MIELDERLAQVARSMTEGIEVVDPSGPSRSPAHRRSRSGVRVGGGALLAAAAAAVVAVLVWTSGAPAPTDTVVAGGAAAATPVAGERSPVTRFRAAMETALSTGVTVRVETVERAGTTSSLPAGSSPLPVVIGQAGAVDVQTTIDGPLEASTSPVTIDVGRIHVRDARDRRSYWQVGPGRWQRAAFDEPSLADQLRAFAASSCITTASGRSDVVFVTTGSGPCVDDPLEREGGPDTWVATLDADGRVASIAPVVDLASPEPDLRSRLTFSGHGAVDVELPDPTTVVDVASPQSWGVDASTGWAVLSDAFG